jgi:hypothetical protein
MKQLMDNLPKWNKFFVLPLFTVFISTGPLYLTNQFHAACPTVLRSISIMPPQLYSFPGGYLKHFEGNSWHCLDATVLNWAWAHQIDVFILFGAVIALYIKTSYGTESK